MTLTKFDFYLGMLLLSVSITGGLVAHGYLSSKKADHEALDHIKQQVAPAEKAADQAITQAKSNEVQNQKDLQAKVTIIHEQQAAPVLPVDYAKIDAMIQAHLQTPSKTQTVDNTPETTVDTKALRNFALSCDEASTGLDSCKQTTQNQQTQIQALTTEKQALQQEVAAEDKVIKGGSFWHRVGRGLKHSLCGAAGMGAGLVVAKGTDKAGAGAIAGGATWAGCEALVSK